MSRPLSNVVSFSQPGSGHSSTTGGIELSPAVVFGVHAALFTLPAWWSWLKWADPLIDFGRELYLPWQIVRGKVLYRDIESLFGPHSPYVNALWFRLFGVSILTLVLVNLIIFAGIVAGIHRLVLLSTDRFTASIASLVALALFGFLHPARVGNYNFVTPYSHEATHGLALGIAMLIALHAALSGGRIVAGAIAGLAFGLLLLTKIEVSLAACAAAAVAFLAAAARVADRRRTGLIVAVFAGTATLPSVLFFAYFLRYMDARTAMAAIARNWIVAFESSVASNAYYVTGMGLDRPAFNAMLMILTFAAFLAYTAVMGFVCWQAARRALSPTATDFAGMALLGVAPVAMLFGFPRAQLHVFGEDKLLSALRSSPPRFVLLVYKDMSEYGFPPFGANARYGERTWSWITSHYRRAGRFGEGAPTPSGFGMELLEFMRRAER